MAAGPESAPRVRAALERAATDARDRVLLPTDGQPRTLELVMGDPQAPFEKVLAILDRHRLLGEEGRLRPDVRLFSIGDHFDYGESTQLSAIHAEQSGRLLLSWLAAHPPDQVTLIVGNHDLARVGELVRFDDARFARARALALRAQDDPEAEARFLTEFPELPSSEVARRDFNGFSVAQRELVAQLLRGGRFLAACAHGQRTLLCHAGVSLDDVSGASDASAIAAGLNARLAQAVAAWNGSEPLSVPGLHQPGSAENGEGGGIFYHRPCHPAHAHSSSFAGPLRRRYDPRRIPAGIVQVIGHIRDNKCRELLGPWVLGPAAREGALRHLVSDGRDVRYEAGAPSELDPARAHIVFVDGGMNDASVDDYELYDLAAGRQSAR